MHPSSLENMHLCLTRFVRGTDLDSRTAVSVLDVGGADVNGSYRALFSDPHFIYTAVDLSEGPGVDVVLPDPYRMPFADGSADIVLCGQMLEHCEFFWLAFAEMVRVLAPDGYLFLIAPSAGPIHRYPVDCYRFYPDAYRALAKYAGCHLVDVWRDTRGPWQDLVGVFQRQVALRDEAKPRYEPKPIRLHVGGTPPPPENSGTAETEAVRGAASYLDMLAGLHETLAPSTYLEVGVGNGHSLAVGRCRAVGIDPAPSVTVDLPETAEVVESTADDAFAAGVADRLGGPIDLAFIDGLHLFEFALRDFINIERKAAPASVIVFSSAFPNHPDQGRRTRCTRIWTGDVWQIAAALRHWRPDLLLVAIDTAPAGSLLVAGLDPKSNVLLGRYNLIVSGVWKQDDPAPSEPVLQRTGAVPPDHPGLQSCIQWLRRAREESADVTAVRSGLLPWRSAFGPSSQD